MARLVLPVQCPGCGVWDQPLCPPCERLLRGCLGDGPVRRCEQHVPRLDRMDGTTPLPVWVATDYAGPVRGVVVAWKDRGRTDLSRPLGRAATDLGRGVAADLATATAGEPVRVVPVPSTARARRRRGEDLVGGLAAAVARGLTEQGVPAHPVPRLSRRGGGRDQVGLGARARDVNTAGAWRLRPGYAEDRRAPHLLVDDVVTTGSTLAGCERALSGSGALVLGAVVLAATPPPTRDL
ncbi:ComF family protein [Actinotalea sp. BY-33]|uniref:ComF family protein n=1 Tax=Actinotalea soli TaxID=2819234 RepID=A0A939RSE1_9CELL|nr:ComF family protein [Actinotalea soli]